MKKKIIAIIIFFANFYIYSQNTTTVDCKYLASLIYLKTDSEINQKIKIFKKNWLKKEKLGKHEIIDFNISKYVTYLPFPDVELTTNYNLPISSKSHREKYYFDLEEIKTFKDLIPNSQSKLFLLFSKPIDNYLIAEFIINYTNIEIDMIDNKKGPVMQLLFFFDDTGVVKKVYTSYSYYN